MSTVPKTEPLVAILERLERHLELPHVAGELQAWANEAVELLEETDKTIHSTIHSEHPPMFKAIRQNHANLVQQVDKLREEDDRILSASQAVLKQAHHFAASVKETALAEQHFHVPREKLVLDGLALVIQVRRQQAAVSTWLGEALQRDNGVGD